MELSPEERRKIYEEEKARIEAREQILKEKQRISPDNTMGLAPNVAGLLCYLGFWVTGIIFLVLEQKNNWIRFHAAQSIVVFGALFLADLLLGWIPIVGPVFLAVFGLTGFILWIVLMVKAYNGERYKLPMVGDIAERIVGVPGATPDYQPPVPPLAIAAPVAAPPEKPPGKTEAPPAATAPAIDEKISRKVDEFFQKRRTGRITSSAFAIAWSVVLLVFFNFFNQYFGYYGADTSGNIITWTRYTFFTWDIDLWLPVLNTTLAITIVGHFILIVYDRYLLRRVVLLITATLGLATVVTLLAIFPFDFSVIPYENAQIGTEIGARVLLVCIGVGFGITILVRLVMLLVDIGRGTAHFK
ncbi:MAG: hypothetical protein A2Z29_09345 [Chloroflexi bacterium RBG_16_56_11]|nr:MAG: hypothetical protein A2Z29_09345 [Chloroflexi bacterium RBG_16_56_11]